MEEDEVGGSSFILGFRQSAVMLEAFNSKLQMMLAVESHPKEIYSILDSSAYASLFDKF